MTLRKPQIWYLSTIFLLDVGTVLYFFAFHFIDLFCRCFNLQIFFYFIWNLFFIVNNSTERRINCSHRFRHYMINIDHEDFQSNRLQVKSAPVKLAPVKSAPIQIGLKSNWTQVKSASKWKSYRPKKNKNKERINK
jgi:hypothetical protein